METLSLAGLQYRISRMNDPRAPLCLMLHGRSGDLSSMTIFNRCLPPIFNRIYVQAPLPDPDGGFSWWTASDERSFADKAKPAAEALRDFLFQALRSHQLFPACQMAIGFSQGAAVLSYLAQKHPGLFDSLALLSGFVVRLSPEENQRICGGRQKAKLFMAHGAGDDTIPVQRARDDVQHLRALGYEVAYLEENAGHKAGIEAIRALKIWIEGQVSRFAPT